MARSKGLQRDEGQGRRWRAAAGLALILLLPTLAPIASAAPSPPTASSPGSASESSAPEIASSQTFSWSGVTGATSYTVYISKSPYGGANLILTRSGITGTSVTISKSDINAAGGSATQFRWGVTASNSAGESTQSNVLYFKATPPLSAPSAPSATSPGSSSEGSASEISSSQTFSWSSVSGATSYTVYISKSPYGGSNVILTRTASSNSITISKSDINAAGASATQFRWGVTASNSGGESAQSNVLYFKATPPVIAPSAPSAYGPGSSSEGSAGEMLSSETFSWSSVAGATSYTVYVSKSPYGGSNLILTRSVTGTSTTISKSDINAAGGTATQFRWGVTASNSGGESTQSNVLYFKATPPVTAPSAPTASGPGSSSESSAGEMASSETFSWSGVSGATSYTVYVSKSPYGGSNVVLTRSVAGTSTTISKSDINAAGGSASQFRWGVTASNAGGESPQSNVLYFKATPPVTAPSVPTASAPGSSSEGSAGEMSSSETFSWSSVAGATSYTVYVSKSPYGGSNLILTKSGIAGTSVSISKSEINAAGGSASLFRWGVTASNSGGESAQSNVLYFKATPPVTAPSPPTASGPGSSSEGSATEIGSSETFSWSSVAGATSYTVYVSKSPYGGSNVILTRTATSNSLSISKSEITAAGGTASQFRWGVTASNSGGESAQSNVLYFKATPAVAGLTVSWSSQPPLTVTSGATFSVSWTSTGSPDHHNVHWDPSDPKSASCCLNGASSTSSSTPHPTSSPVTLTAPTVSNSTVVKYVVHVKRSTDDAEAWSSVVSVTVNPVATEAPGIPFRLTPGQRSAIDVPGESLPGLTATLEWSAPTGTVTKYKIYYRAEPYTGAVSTQEVTTTTWTTPALACGTSYRWQVEAYNGASVGAVAPSSTERMYFKTKACESSASAPDPDSLQIAPAPASYATCAHPAHDARKRAIDSIVIHNDATTGSYESLVAYLSCPSDGRAVSAHYVVALDGRITRIVPEAERAWHATYYNDRSVGIEIEGTGSSDEFDFERNPAMYRSLAALVAKIARDHGISVADNYVGAATGLVHGPGNGAGCVATDGAGRCTRHYQQPLAIAGIVGHGQVQPELKSDPGPHFDWPRFMMLVRGAAGVDADPEPDLVLVLDALAPRVQGPRAFFTTVTNKGTGPSNPTTLRLRTGGQDSPMLTETLVDVPAIQPGDSRRLVVPSQREFGFVRATLTLEGSTAGPVAWTGFVAGKGELPGAPLVIAGVNVTPVFHFRSSSVRTPPPQDWMAQASPDLLGIELQDTSSGATVTDASLYDAYAWRFIRSYGRQQLDLGYTSAGLLDGTEGAQWASTKHELEGDALFFAVGDVPLDLARLDPHDWAHLAKQLAFSDIVRQERTEAALDKALRGNVESVEAIQARQSLAALEAGALLLEAVGGARGLANGPVARAVADGTLSHAKVADVFRALKEAEHVGENLARTQSVLEELGLFELSRPEARDQSCAGARRDAYEARVRAEALGTFQRAVSADSAAHPPSLVVALLTKRDEFRDEADHAAAVEMVLCHPEEFRAAARADHEAYGKDSIVGQLVETLGSETTLHAGLSVGFGVFFSATKQSARLAHAQGTGFPSLSASLSHLRAVRLLAESLAFVSNWDETRDHAYIGAVAADLATRAGLYESVNRHIAAKRPIELVDRVDREAMVLEALRRALVATAMEELAKEDQQWFRGVFSDERKISELQYAGAQDRVASVAFFRSLANAEMALDRAGVAPAAPSPTHTALRHGTVEFGSWPEVSQVAVSLGYLPPGTSPDVLILDPSDTCTLVAGCYRLFAGLNVYGTDGSHTGVRMSFDTDADGRFLEPAIVSLPATFDHIDGIVLRTPQPGAVLAGKPTFLSFTISSDGSIVTKKTGVASYVSMQSPADVLITTDRGVFGVENGQVIGGVPGAERFVMGHEKWYLVPDVNIQSVRVTGEGSGTYTLTVGQASNDDSQILRLTNVTTSLGAVDSLHLDAAGGPTVELAHEAVVGIDITTVNATVTTVASTPDFSVRASASALPSFAPTFALAHILPAERSPRAGQPFTLRADLAWIPADALLRWSIDDVPVGEGAELTVGGLEPGTYTVRLTTLLHNAGGSTLTVLEVLPDAKYEVVNAGLVYRGGKPFASFEARNAGPRVATSAFLHDPLSGHDGQPITLDVEPGATTAADLPLPVTRTQGEVFLVLGESRTAIPLWPIRDAVLTSCPPQGAARSTDSAQRTSLEVRNAGPHPIEIVWLGYEGQRVSYGSLAAGETRDQVTFLSHPWVFLAEDGECLGAFVATGDPVRLSISKGRQPVPWSLGALLIALAAAALLARWLPRR